MRPKNLKTKIYLDSGDPTETKAAIDRLGFLDGQTTNPSLIAKNPDASDKKFSEQEVYDFYKHVVQEISGLIPDRSVSIEVYAEKKTPARKMVKQAQAMYEWIPNAHIKLPITAGGLEAAQRLTEDKIRVNMTLCFTQQQAAAVYAATRGAQRSDVYVSPFDGRLDDLGECGVCLIEDIMKMFSQGDGHVETLMASVRNIDHLLYAIYTGVDIITVPFKVLKEWGDAGMPVPKELGNLDTLRGLKKIEYQELDLTQDWKAFDISHPLTDKGLVKFAADWNNLIK
ncbi:MAG: transaldolase [Candidatus Buchananbacteria bacterium CG10_big_fil_rev_8_21_14_0_10_42_9]|uniref:Transaldolase n=1 Tax=Candidatus Buchananbacteria bacterium CG10_big_fil_rev_8_21_14_0_10_42_9 TaxID=1974526 RepID=A0A2H0W1V9_9BACT|nr:MAG: transaldolase [Candidatus Buchananbacteria bacterium CG10_big_fil_rev_8_21_14_0_10_42_9]